MLSIIDGVPLHMLAQATKMMKESQGEKITSAISWTRVAARSVICQFTSCGARQGYVAC